MDCHCDTDFVRFCLHEFLPVSWTCKAEYKALDSYINCCHVTVNQCLETHCPENANQISETGLPELGCKNNGWIGDSPTAPKSDNTEEDT